VRAVDTMTASLMLIQYFPWGDSGWS
jgi:hypothetical protein